MRGSPEVVRPTSWTEWVALPERKCKGGFVFPAVLFEQTSSDPCPRKAVGIVAVSSDCNQGRWKSVPG